LPRSGDSAAREWERFLKGAAPTLPVTFDQRVAAENPAVAHLSLTHPLVRQAAHYAARTEPAETHLVVRDISIPSATYRFAIYRWTLHGVRSDEQLVVVTDTPEIDAVLLPLLLRAEGHDRQPSSEPEDFRDLDARHHTKWADAVAKHAADNRQTVEYRIQSLNASHAARRRVIEDQIARATNEKIQIMRKSELGRADADYARHLAELERAAEAGDIHTAPVLFGVLTVRGAP
jgi:ATP-dependent helicase HepA